MEMGNVAILMTCVAMVSIVRFTRLIPSSSVVGAIVTVEASTMTFYLTFPSDLELQILTRG